MSGGNIDTTTLGRVLERGLAADGRLIKADVVVKDQAGGIGELCQRLGAMDANIKHIVQERAWLQSDVYSVRVSQLINL